jgi:hypothetical protein
MAIESSYSCLDGFDPVLLDYMRSEQSGFRFSPSDRNNLKAALVAPKHGKLIPFPLTTESIQIRSSSMESRTSHQKNSP